MEKSGDTGVAALSASSRQPPDVIRWYIIVTRNTVQSGGLPMFTPSQYSGQPDQDYPLLHKQLRLNRGRAESYRQPGQCIGLALARLEGY